MTLRNALMGHRGTGCIPNPPDSRDADMDVLGLSSSDLPDLYTLWTHVTKIRNQGPINSCTGEALAAALDIRERFTLAKAGNDPHASSLMPYFFGRYPDRADAGANLRRVCKAAQKVGVCDETFWPFVRRRVNKQPLPVALMNAHHRAGGKFVAIRDTSLDGRMLAIKAAVCAGYPVISGASIDRAYQANSGPDIIDVPTGPIIGGHARCWIGFKPDLSHGTVVEELNSYSANWRRGGRAWVTPELVARCHDLTIVHGWNNLKRAA